MTETESLDEPAAQRSGARRVVVHSLWNAVGQGIPLLVGVVAVPFLVRALGAERFGLLTLAWTGIGYFSLFDFGLGRALTQIVAERRDSVSPQELASITGLALAWMCVLGVVGGLIVLLASPWIATRGLSVSPALVPETLLAFRILALGIPLTVVTTGLRGVLEAYERFDLTNRARIPLGASTFLGPLLLVPLTTNLAAGVAALVVVRLAVGIVYVGMVRRMMPCLRVVAPVRLRPLAFLIRSGAWMTVSNVISPLMTSADRFLIGGLASAAVVAYYTAPYEMVTKLMGLTAVAVATALFPAFANSGRAGRSPLYGQGMLLTAVTFLPISLALVLFAPEVLSGWMGGAFAANSQDILRILALGVFANGIAQVPFALIQAVGRADLTAKLHIAEAPLYLAAAIPLIRADGPRGAAIAWTLRVVVDAAALLVVAARVSPAAASAPRRVWSFLAVAAVGALSCFALRGQPISVRAAVGSVMFAVLACYAWRVTATAEERRTIVGLVLGRLSAGVSGQ